VYHKRTGTYFFAEPKGHRIRQYIPGKGTQKGSIITIIGNGRPGANVGGPQTARLNAPHGLALDEANDILYIADTHNHRICQLDLTTHTLSVLAGSTANTGGVAGHVDATSPNTSSTAQFNAPMDIALQPSRNELWVADTGNHTIRRINLGTKVVDTPIGPLPNVNGKSKIGYVDNRNNGIRFSRPSSIAFVGSSLFVADRDNGVIREVTFTQSTGIFQSYTFAGKAADKQTKDGKRTAARFADPYRLTTGMWGTPPRVHLFVNGPQVNTVRLLPLHQDDVTTLIAQDDATVKPALKHTGFVFPLALVSPTPNNLITTNRFGRQFHITADAQGKVTATDIGNAYQVEKLATGHDARFRAVLGMSFAGTATNGAYHLFVSGGGSANIYHIDDKQKVSLFAGTGTVGHKDANTPTQAQFASVKDVTTAPKGNFLYIIEHNDDKNPGNLRRIHLTGNNKGKTETFVGLTGRCEWKTVKSTDPLKTCYLDAGKKSAFLDGPSSIIISNVTENIYISDTESHRIVRASPNLAAGQVTAKVIANTRKLIGASNTFGTNATFHTPRGLHLRSQQAADVSLYIADTGNNCIRRMDLASTRVVTFLGICDPNKPGSQDGPKGTATFNQPIGINARVENMKLAFYIADTRNHAIRKITNVSTTATAVWDVSTITSKHSANSGAYANYGMRNHTLDKAMFTSPISLVWGAQSGELFIGSQANLTIRRVFLP
jgi:hypothetical protein